LCLEELLRAVGHKFNPRFLINTLRHQVIVCSARVGGRLLNQVAKSSLATAIWSSMSAILVGMSGIDDLLLNSINHRTEKKRPAAY
jgi:hypothetical protein